MLRRIEIRGAIEIAHRTQQNCRQIFRYAIASGKAERDPSADLRGALAPIKKGHHASITDPKAKDIYLSPVETLFQKTDVALIRQSEINKSSEEQELDLGR